MSNYQYNASVWYLIPCFICLKRMTVLFFTNVKCQAKTALGEFVVRELSAAAGAITITCLMVCFLCFN